eukprot:scaffold1117_cov167-Amphora_coffeaeformis.AAC.9
MSWNQQPLSVPSNTQDEHELSSGEASTDGGASADGIGLEAFQPKASPSYSQSSKLPPRVIQLRSNSYRCISNRHLFDDGDVPDFDKTESSSDTASLDDPHGCDDALEGKIEVADGVLMRLRGSQETQTAWDCGECIETMCFICEIQLACVRDCDCVICPQCRLVSPVDHVPKAAGFRRPHSGGVGLGIML